MPYSALPILKYMYIKAKAWILLEIGKSFSNAEGKCFENFKWNGISIFIPRHYGPDKSDTTKDIDSIAHLEYVPCTCIYLSI